MGPVGQAQSLIYTRDSPPRTNGNGDLRQWKLAVQNWAKMHEKLLENNLKGTPAELRGLVLLGHLSGSARAIAQHVPQDIIESKEGVKAIVDAIVVSDPVSDTQRLHNSWETLGSTTR